MATQSPVFDETYKDYLKQITELDRVACQAVLGCEIKGDQSIIPFFNAVYHVGPDGVYDAQGLTPRLSVCVVLFKYLLMCPDKIPPQGGLSAYKDFKDARPLIHYFSNSVEGEVVRNFCGKAADLDKACLALGGEPYGADLAYQIKYQFTGLPRVPVYLLYNDAEEGFSAQCNILFESRAETFLDMESVAMLGSTLSQMLISTAKREG